MKWLIDLVLESMVGIIVAWSGTYETIPTGWALCDGTNGTPDLSGLFIRGATGFLTPGDTGGDTAHVHSLTMAQHFHGFEPGPGGWTAGASKRDDRTAFAVSTGDADVESHLPPYMLLAYIMKL